MAFMGNEYILWICVAVYAMHALEEKILDGNKWFDPKMLKFKLGSTDFYVVQAMKILVGICCAMVGWRNTSFSLLFPAVLVLSAIFSHIIPAIRTKKFNPGLLTSVFLLIPIGIWSYVGAYKDTVLCEIAFIASIILGCVVKWAPSIYLRLAKK
jgi:hypothetical protein